MANYAHVENNEIVGVYDNLPANWRNVSNFYALPENILETLGWYKLVKQIPTFDSETQKLSDPVHYFDNGTAYETFNVVSKGLPPTPSEEQVYLEQQRKLNDQWILVRALRDEKMKDFEWRYTRYERHLRLGLTQIDTLESLDLYMQQLADITNQEDPFNLIWPEYTEN